VSLQVSLRSCRARSILSSSPSRSFWSKGSPSSYRKHLCLDVYKPMSRLLGVTKCCNTTSTIQLLLVLVIRHANPQVTTVGMDKMAQIQMSNDAEDQFYKSCKLFLGEIKAQMRGGSYGRVRGEDLLACKSFTSKKTLIPKPTNRRQAPAEAMLYALHLYPITRSA
jgi:hypothetical protein